MSKSDQRLTNIFKNQTKRICSLEFSSKKEIDYGLVDTIPFSFCSLIWIGEYLPDLTNIEYLVFSPFSTKMPKTFKTYSIVGLYSKQNRKAG